jgi:hypothetical protein
MYKKFNRHSDVLPSGFSINSPKSSFHNPLNKENLEYTSLGSRIRRSQAGMDVLGVQVVPEFDDKSSEDIDVRTVCKMDAFDQAEMYGSAIESENKLE